MIGIPKEVQDKVRAQATSGKASTPIPNVQTAPQATQKSVDLSAAEAAVRVQGQFGKSLAAAEESKLQVKTGNEAGSVSDSAKMASDKVMQPTDGVNTAEWDTAIKHVADVVETATKKAGQPGCNPFLWRKHNVDPLIEAYRNGDRSKELLKKLASLVCPEHPTHEMKGYTTFGV